MRCKAGRPSSTGSRWNRCGFETLHLLPVGVRSERVASQRFRTYREAGVSRHIPGEPTEPELDTSDAAATRSIAENSPDNIMLLDREARIRYINWTVPD